MTRSSCLPTGSRGIFAGFVVAIGLLAATAPATSEPAILDGSWNGGGTLTFPSGDKEKARCRATFRRQGGDRVTMSAVCTTPSARASQTAELVRVGANRYSGEFFNAEYNISGAIRITVLGNSLTASLNGGGAQAVFSLSR